MVFNSWTNGTENLYKLTGNEEQKEWKVFDFNARMYDPAIGRFNSIDPLSESQISWNPYHYNYNNPVAFVDPTGLRPTYSATEALEEWRREDHTKDDEEDSKSSDDDGSGNGFVEPKNKAQREFNTATGRGYLNNAHDFYLSNSQDALARVLEEDGVIVFVKDEHGNIIPHRFSNDAGMQVVKAIFDYLIDETLDPLGNRMIESDDPQQVLAGPGKWGKAMRYRVHGRTRWKAIDHIVDRHKWDSTWPNVSRFSKTLSDPLAIKQLVQRGIQIGTSDVNGNIIANFNKVIGLGRNGNWTKKLLIHVDSDGWVRSAYPLD